MEATNRHIKNDILTIILTLSFLLSVFLGYIHFHHSSIEAHTLTLEDKSHSDINFHISGECFIANFWKTSKMVSFIPLVKTRKLNFENFFFFQTETPEIINLQIDNSRAPPIS